MYDCLLRVGNSVGTGGKVAVVFSSANASSYTYYKTFTQFKNLTVIFVRDPFLLHWYQSGIGNGINSWPELIDVIRNELKSVDYSDISFWGSSMGGYAALRASLAFEKSTCFAFSPQTVLNDKLPHNIKSTTKATSQLQSGVKFVNKLDGRISVIVGGADLVDLFHVFSGALPSDIVFPVFEGDHLVSAALHKSGVIDDLINHWINEDYFTVEEVLHARDVKLDRRPYDPAFLKLVYRAVEAFYINEDYVTCTDILNNLLKFGDNSGVYMLKGHILALDQKIQDAEFYFEKALETSTSVLEPSKQFAAILLVRGKYNEAIKYYDIALSARPHDYDSLCGISICYSNIGKMNDARLLLMKAIEVRPLGTRAKKIVSKYAIDLSQQ